MQGAPAKSPQLNAIHSTEAIPPFTPSWPTVSLGHPLGANEAMAAPGAATRSLALNGSPALTAGDDGKGRITLPLRDLRRDRLARVALGDGLLEADLLGALAEPDALGAMAGDAVEEGGEHLGRG